MSEISGWLAIVYRLSSLPSRNRVYIWRKLKETGAVFYQQGVALLPNSECFLSFMNELRKKIISFGGEAIILRFNFDNPEDEIKITEEFNLAVQNDYRKAEKFLLKVLDDIETIRNEDKLSLSYLETCFKSLHKIKKLHEKIKSRDHFKINENFEAIVEASLERVQKYRLEFQKHKGLV